MVTGTVVRNRGGETGGYNLKQWSREDALRRSHLREEIN